MDNCKEQLDNEIKYNLIDSILSYKNLFLDDQIKRNLPNNNIVNLLNNYKIMKEYSEFQQINENEKSIFKIGNNKNSNKQEMLNNNELLLTNNKSQAENNNNNITEKSLVAYSSKVDKKKEVNHPNWKLYRVMSGHTGWVRCIDVDSTNNWFVTGSNDRVIKFWDLASGKLKLTLTGHINTVRGLVVSSRHPYLFSCGEDKRLICWDLEQNKVVREYHGHLSGIYCLSLHPTLDILVSGGRDCVVRIWDIRSRQQIMVFEGHMNTICSLITQENNPQVISGSNDSTIKLWDITAGKAYKTLTHHKKSIRSLAIPENEYTFISGGCDNIKVWKCPEGIFLRNCSSSGHHGILNTIAVNKDGVLVSGDEDGKLIFRDYQTGTQFQEIDVPVQPGTLSCESGIFDIKFDKTSTRMITAGCDKTIKMWKEEINEDLMNIDEDDEDEK